MKREDSLKRNENWMVRILSSKKGRMDLAEACRNPMPRIKGAFSSKFVPRPYESTCVEVWDGKEM